MEKGISDMKVKTSTFVKIALGGMALVLFIAIISLYVNLKNLEKEKNSLSVLIEEYQKSIVEMEYDLSLPKEDYIEKYAREVLGYHKNGELVFVDGEK